MHTFKELRQIFPPHILFHALLLFDTLEYTYACLSGKYSVVSSNIRLFPYRYGNILPYDHSLVKLRLRQGVDGSDYINANYICGFNHAKEFVATQGPKNNTLEDFWRMIWETDTPGIVMLTKLKEKKQDGKEIDKCQR